MSRIDDFPTHEKDGVHYRCGHITPYGATLINDNQINFSVFSKDATGCELILFHKGEEKPYAVIPLTEEFRIGNVYTVIIYESDFDEIEYGYRFDGPYDPEKGYRFDKKTVLMDPCAKLISGREEWGKKPNFKSSFQHRSCIIREDYDWEGDVMPDIPIDDLIIYEAHVRGFTKDNSSEVKHPGTYAGFVEKIPYLKSLGVNCIELMPVFEFDEFENSREYEGNRLLNYWGYSTVGFYAPKAGYAFSGKMGFSADEFKNLVKKMHKAGIEVILDVVFNHTAEGNENGPYISYRGIDNRTYYLLTPEGYYYNFSGCGNTMNCNNVIVRDYILDCLRYWVYAYHIDGFRFDLASILTRDAFGAPLANPPLIEALAQDAVLGKTKLIAEAWDAGGLYQVGNFYGEHWAEWNGKYRDCVRNFIRGDAQSGIELIWRIKGSPDLYGDNGSNRSINFVTCHDGFTLYDLVSYNQKHNEKNGENNNDGCNDNNSWNCGIEGDEGLTPEVASLRDRQMKNAIMLLMISRGVPMLLSGDEFKNSQFGNNNAYCQDNEISWLNWENQEKNSEMVQFFQKLIAFRKLHPVMRQRYFFSGNLSNGYPEMSFHGTIPWDFDDQSPFLCFAVMYCETKKDHKVRKDTFIYCAVNAFWEDKDFELPIIPEGMKWKKLLYSGDMKIKEELITESVVHLMSRSSMLLIAE